VSANGPATEQQRRVLAAICAWVEKHGEAPVSQDIASRLGLDVDTVDEEVAALARDGWVTLAGGGEA
jgi:Mn-dependent DtxR family transcriptional regulator